MPDQRCWKCGTPLPPGNEPCPVCGARRREQAQGPATGTPQALNVQPTVAGPSRRDVRAQQVQPQQAPASPPGVQQVVASGARQAHTRAAAAEPGNQILGEAFFGSVASVGMRLLAFTIDVILVAAVAAGIWWLTSSVIVGVVVLLEGALVTIVMQARTGASIGARVCGLRVSQQEEPRSPGLGRAAVRALVTGVGWLVAAVGAWIVEATGPADPTKRGRTWADRAAGTVMVSVPDRRTRALVAGGGFEISASQSRPPRRAAVASGATVPAATPAVPPANQQAGMSGAQLPAPPVPGVQAVEARPQAPAPTPALPAPASHTMIAAAGAPSAGVLLVFDTGQRENLPEQAAVNLGRAPLVSVPGDIAIVVQDPERMLSKNHARLEISRSGSWVTDLGSTNGTGLVDETGSVEVLAPGVRTEITDGKRVKVGGRTFTVSRLMGEGE